MSEERRRFTRVLFNGKCFLQDGKDTYEGNLLDISVKGALIEPMSSEVPCVYSPKKSCMLKIVLNDSNTEITAHVEMVHRRDDGLIGLYFTQIDIDSLTHLRKLIELNMGDADKALAEILLWPKA
jgi:hypothetical protein